MKNPPLLLCQLFHYITAVLRGLKAALVEN